MNSAQFISACVFGAIASFDYFAYIVGWLSFESTVVSLLYTVVASLLLLVLVEVAE